MAVQLVQSAVITNVNLVYEGFGRESRKKYTREKYVDFYIFLITSLSWQEG
jgi:hypothetical protein